MAVKIFLIFVTVFAYVQLLSASPTRRQFVAITEATASDNPGTVWEDNDEFDLDGEGWFSQAVVSPSSAPEKVQDFNEYDDDYSQSNVMVDFGGEDDEEEDEDDEDHREQEAEEEDEEGSRNDSEFLFVPPKDTRLVLEDDDDDQSGPIKVRHTGRNSYSRVPEGGDDSLESSDEDVKNDKEHPYEFTIDEDKEEDDFADDDEEDDSVEVVPRRESRENDDDEDEFVSEGDDREDVFDNPEEEAAQVIYGDHVFLY